MVKTHQISFLIIFIIFLPTLAFALSATEKAELERDLQAIEDEIDEIQVDLDGVKNERATLENNIKIIDGNVRREELGIRAREISISKLQGDIEDKKSTISTLDEDLESIRDRIADLVKRSDVIEQKSFLHLFFSDGSLSDFFVKLNDYKTLQKDMKDSFQEILITQKVLGKQRESLIQERSEEEYLKRIQTQRKVEIEKQRQEKANILKVTKGVEANYQKLIKEKEQTASEIRSQLFVLRGSNPIPFGLALEYAEDAEKATGVRAAFILAIITQETELGSFLGNGNWREDLHPIRDLSVFKEITDTLRINRDKAPVSRSLSYGYGGAMGPAQFIPSTWACYGGYLHSGGSCSYNTKYSAGSWRYFQSKDRVRSVLNLSSPSNPWEPKTAFTASALLLKDNGAVPQTDYREWCAALRYYSGTCKSRIAQNRFYADSVERHAISIQKKIDILKRQG